MTRLVIQIMLQKGWINDYYYYYYYESDSGNEGNVVIKCSRCKKPYHLRACQGKRPKNRGEPRLSEHQKKTRTVLSSLGFEEFLRSETCVPSLVFSLLKISSRDAETAGIRGSRFNSRKTQVPTRERRASHVIFSLRLWQSLVDHPQAGWPC